MSTASADGRPAVSAGATLLRMLWSVIFSMVFVLAVVSYCWHLGGTTTQPLIPGEYLCRALHAITDIRSPNFYAAMFLDDNVLFWAVVLFGAASLVAWRRNKRRLKKEI